MLSLNIILIILVASAGTYIWRAAGTFLGSIIIPDGAISKWISCVAYAMLAGLISRILIFPIGILSETSLAERLLATAIGIAAYFLLKRNIFFATFFAGASFFAIIS